MRYAWTPKFQLSDPTVHSLYCGYIKLEKLQTTHLKILYLFNPLMR